MRERALKVTRNNHLINRSMKSVIEGGKPRELIFKIVREKAKIILSKEILEEFIEVTDDSRIRKYVDEEDKIAFLKIIGNTVNLVKVKSRFKVVREDPSDDVVLRTAYDGRAEFIVSGDRHLLSLEEFRKIKIVTVAQMLDII